MYTLRGQEGMEVQSSVGKWGNSPAVRIPVALIKEAKLSIKQPVRVAAEVGRIIIEPLEVVDYDINKLVSGITKENLHSDVDFGDPVGKEAW